MANVPNDLTTLNGFFKTVYGELHDLIPEGVKLSKMIPFVAPAKRMGLEYKSVVTLGLEHGVTYGGDSGDMFDLKEAVAGATKEATVKGTEMVLRAQLSFAAISRSINDAASFGKATKHVVRNLMTSTFKKHEYQLFYGQSGLAKISAIDATNKIITIAAAHWAPGIWAGAEKMKLDVYNVTDDNLDTTQLQITFVDILGKALTVSETLASGASLATLKTDFDGGDDMDLFEYGAYGKEFAGLHKILTTTSGTVFGIDTAAYSLWSGNVYSASNAALTFDKISQAIALSVAKGLEGKLSMFVNPVTWADLLSEQTAQRMFDKSYDVKKYENGSQTIMFYSQNGTIEIISSTYVKEGFAYGLALDTMERVGSSEVTFKIPGTTDDFILTLEGKNGIEFRTYCDVALFCTAIGHNLVINNIQN